MNRTRTPPPPRRHDVWAPDVVETIYRNVERRAYRSEA